ncbi:MAG: hypothetical protein LBI81_02860 [Puniceicoccales bacterium]|jgi:hypothetical protein|nr:hypothetical protein [Puniceicoccales bacterium]
MDTINTYRSDPVTLFTTADGAISCISSQSIADEFNKLGSLDREDVIESLRDTATRLNFGEPRDINTAMTTHFRGVSMQMSAIKTPLGERSAEETKFCIRSYEFTARVHPPYVMQALGWL